MCGIPRLSIEILLPLGYILNKIKDSCNLKFI